jgi:hypothetical protein
MFDTTFRALISMMFDRNTVNEISGKLDEDRSWTINVYRPTEYKSYTHYDGYIAGAYGVDFRGDTLDETMDKMEAYLAGVKLYQEMTA